MPSAAAQRAQITRGGGGVPWGHSSRPPMPSSAPPTRHRQCQARSVPRGHRHARAADRRHPHLAIPAAPSRAPLLPRRHRQPSPPPPRHSRRSPPTGQSAEQQKKKLNKSGRGRATPPSGGGGGWSRMGTAPTRPGRPASSARPPRRGWRQACCIRYDDHLAGDTKRRGHHASVAAITPASLLLRPPPANACRRGSRRCGRGREGGGGGGEVGSPSQPGRPAPPAALPADAFSLLHPPHSLPFPSHARAPPRPAATATHPGGPRRATRSWECRRSQSSGGRGGRLPP